MQPCLERLSATISSMNVATAFASALGAAAAGPAQAGSAPNSAEAPAPIATHRWSVSLPVLRLRESGQAENLALELGLALRLEDVETGRLAGYELLLSGPGLPLQDPLTPGSPLYSTIVPERATPRPVDDWCGPDGADLLSAEIAQALKNVAAQVVRGLR